MGTPIRTKIDSFVSKRYIAAIIQNKDIRKHCGTNVMITTYFKTQLSHIQTDSINEKKKFFFSFRIKYLKDFKSSKKTITDKISEFKRRAGAKKFKDSFTETEWENINGDRLLALMALSDKSRINTDFELMKGASKIINNKSK